MRAALPLARARPQTMKGSRTKRGSCSGTASGTCTPTPCKRTWTTATPRELLPLSCEGRWDARNGARWTTSLGGYMMTLVDCVDTQLVVGDHEAFARSLESSPPKFI